MADNTFHTVKGRCPACNRESLFLGSAGHITCAHIDCPDPTAVDDHLNPTNDNHTDPARTGRRHLGRAMLHAAGGDSDHKAALNAALATASLLDAILERLDNQQPTGACTAYYTQQITSDIRTTHPCIYTHGHTGAHRNTDGNTWTNPSPYLYSPDCELTHPHPGHCTTPNDPDTCGPAICDQPRPDHGDRQYTTTCIRPTGHTGTHEDEDGGTW